MALLIPIDGLSPARLMFHTGHYYAYELKWHPCQHFLVEVKPGYELEMYQRNRDWFSVTTGKHLFQHDEFCPDLFILRQTKAQTIQQIAPVRRDEVYYSTKK